MCTVETKSTCTKQKHDISEISTHSRVSTHESEVKFVGTINEIHDLNYTASNHESHKVTVTIEALPVDSKIPDSLTTRASSAQHTRDPQGRTYAEERV